MHIKKFRNARKMTMADLADASGVDISTISRLESTPGRIASVETLVCLADALGIDPQQLLPKRLRRPRLPPPTSTESESSAA